MPTGAEGNGLTDLDAYITRTNTWAAGDQVGSADLNAIQDGIIDVSNAVDELAGLVAVSRTGTRNLGDSPQPAEDGGGEVWVEAESNGATIIALDTSIDWRDRFVVVQGICAITSSTVFPGSGGDDAVLADLTDTTSSGTAINSFFYSQQGHSGVGTPTAYAIANISTGNTARVFVRTDGVLCFKMSPFSTDNCRLMAKVSFSPRQEHY